MSQPHKVWIVGGTGLVGQAVCAALEARGHDVHPTGSEVDITDGAGVLRFARELTPSHIINCAAMTQVDLCESETALAMAVNGAGPKHIAQAALEVGSAVLHISSDYVFDGTQSEPRLEHHPVGPQSQYGHSKLMGEIGFLQQFDGKAAAPLHYVLRTSWVFGPGGGNFVSTMLRLMAEREAVQVVADQHGRPTYTPDLARAILSLMGLDSKNASAAPSGIYHFANSGSTSWHGLCEEVLAQAQAFGHPLRCTRVEPVTTAAFSRPAPRPAYSVLSTTKFEQAVQWVPQPFEQAVANYLGCMTRP